jgi:hypothetical protein
MEYTNLIKYMSIYGVDYVWNNLYHNLELSNIYRLKIEKDLLLFKLYKSIPSENSCIRCGFSYHKYKECYAIKDINGNEINDNKILIGCGKCGRDDHYASLCFYIS